MAAKKDDAHRQTKTQTTKGVTAGGGDDDDDENEMTAMTLVVT